METDTGQSLQTVINKYSGCLHAYFIFLDDVKPQLSIFLVLNTTSKICPTPKVKCMGQLFTRPPYASKKKTRLTSFIVAQ